ncbi:MAG TPA: cell division protein FtsA, partial [Lacibacter sp.]|nr:cell division protein FtsA [Lacibacter sp.]
GGAQLKHLIQLTEYVTGLNARIGFPNEHLAAGHIEELAKPMYSTCIGLILKGYNVYENSLNQLDVSQPAALPAAPEPVRVEQDGTVVMTHPPRGRKTLRDFMNSIKHGLVHLFNEDEDKTFQ